MTYAAYGDWLRAEPNTSGLFVSPLLTHFCTNLSVSLCTYSCSATIHGFPTMGCIEVSAFSGFKKDPLKSIFRYQRQFFVWKICNNVDKSEQSPKQQIRLYEKKFEPAKKQNLKIMIGIKMLYIQDMKNWLLWCITLNEAKNSLTIESTSFTGESKLRSETLASMVFERWWDDDMTRFSRSRLRFRRGCRHSVNSLSD